MSAVIRIWLEASHHAAFRCGGWAYVRSFGEEVAGVAGGDRNITAERAALAGLAAALGDLGKVAGGVAIHTTSARLAGLAGLLDGAAQGEDAPSEDLDLWAQVLTAAAGRKVGFVKARPEPRTPTAFAAAWAELARDKAKAAGAFRAAIPKPNLAKAGLTPA